jgi:hypothetical protein
MSDSQAEGTGAAWKDTRAQHSRGSLPVDSPSDAHVGLMGLPYTGPAKPEQVSSPAASSLSPRVEGRQGCSKKEG